METKVDLMDSLLRAKQTLFTFKEVSSIAGPNTNSPLLRRKISYYVKKGQLHPLRRGIYAKEKKYDKSELASRIYTPSYISFETALFRAGVVLKNSGTIFLASYLTRELNIENQTYSFRKINDLILTNASVRTGVESKGTYSIATGERAFLDTVYLSKDFHFDNLSALDWEKVFELLPMYDNKEMEARVKKHYENFKNADE